MISDLLYYSRKLTEKGYVIGPGGNTSIKDGEFMYIKPSGLIFDELKESDLVKIHIATGQIESTKLRPSSEWLMHLYIYQRRPEVNSVFHAHPPHIIGLSAHDITPKHMFPDSVIFLGRYIPSIGYFKPSTEELAKGVAEGIGKEQCLIMKLHGAVTVGDNPKSAYLRMEILETLCLSNWVALSTNKSSDFEGIDDKKACDILNLESEQYRQKLIEPK